MSADTLPVLRLASGRRVVFRYTSYEAVVLEVSTGGSFTGAVLVVGDPDNAAYEWVHIEAEGVVAHSDAGYGMPAVALRDGLIAALGLPEGGAR